MLKRIIRQLTEHAPFTVVGAVSGMVILLLVIFLRVPQPVSEATFYVFHPLHIIFSALVTTAMLRRFKDTSLWQAIIIGYVGSIGVATLSDAVIPYLGVSSLRIGMEFHLPFLETGKMPYLSVPEWMPVNGAAFIGIAVGYFKPTTKLPHMMHVLLSTWASLFGFTAFGIADWLPLFPFIFVFLFLAVWIPCCVSDIIFPLLWVGNGWVGDHDH